MSLEVTGVDTYVGRTPDYPWGRVYGGQVVSQALHAAALTVPSEHRVHSLHAYFILGGVPKESITYAVDRLRDGRSFTTRRVSARQSAGVILTVDASFQRVEHDSDIQESTLPSDVPGPQSVERSPWGGMGDARELAPTPGVARSLIWMRIPEALDDDPVMHACGLAYLSDHNPMDAIVMSHPGGFDWTQMMNASLDHNIWFHRPARADDWILFDMSGHGLVNARGMATGSAHSLDGVHVATIAQEGLVRSPRGSVGKDR